VIIIIVTFLTIAMALPMIQSMDASLLAMRVWKKRIRKARTMEEELAGNLHTERVRTLGDIATQYIAIIQSGYSDEIWKLFIRCNMPLICAIVAKVLDLLLGPLPWRHVANFYVLILSISIIRRQWPIAPAILVATILVMPAAVSGSFTRIGAAFFCLGTIPPPFVIYLCEIISDRIEVRWVLIGLLLDLIYLFAAAALSWIHLFGYIAVLQIIFVGAGISGMIFLVMILIFINGFWDKYFKLVPLGDSGLLETHPFSRFMEATGRYTVQRLLFPLNRLARQIISTFFDVDVSKKDNQSFRQDGSYEYPKITVPRTVRLLRIEKGWPSEEIECRFEDFQLGPATSYDAISQEADRIMEDPHLEASKSYDAISYVWGTSPDEGSILIDGHRLVIKKRAYEIIHQARSMWMDKLIWIDGVCINQSDTEEKASQVVMMADIYKSARRVTAFLERVDNAHLVQSLFTELHFKMEGLGYSAEALKREYTRESRRAEWEALAEFFGNEWFRRIWIIQEAAHAKELNLFYGNICMDWEYVSRTIAVISNRQLLETLQPSGDEDSCFSNSLRDILIGVGNLDTMLEFRGDINYNRKFDLGMVLKTCARFNATNPRDKVYAVLGLTTDSSRALIQPNYDESYDTASIYIYAMLVILNFGAKPLEALTGAGIGLKRTLKGLPSWVPDWSHHTQIPILDKNYSSGTRYEPTFKIVKQPYTVLVLEGLQFDKVAHLGDAYEADAKLTMVELSSYTQKWYSAAERVAKMHAKDPYHNGQSRTEAFFRTLVGDVLSYQGEEKPSTEECWSHYKAVTRSFVTSEFLRRVEPLLERSVGEHVLNDPFFRRAQDDQEKAARFMHFGGVASNYRRFCVTEEGRMAIVPPLTLPDDIICIIKGSRMPFVLRKSKKKDSLVCQLVGCCYVHGVMDGELQISEAQTFTIL
jgi:Heterokaryon incompatibility protein (HET)